ncbi:MFS transporter [Streptomyces sp. NPDC051576]|uniref:MFS transporter n=1 Tax=Streptomyces sp. NPDC051576 TaxID=3155803 RepID=UPI00341339C0
MLVKAVRGRRRAPGGDPEGRGPGGGGGGGSGRSRYVIPVLLLCALGVALAQAVVVPALPLFQRRLGLDPPAAAWLLTAFMLASAVATPVAGRIGDLVGYRRVMVVCLLCLAVGSALAAVADRGGWFAGMLVGRVVQGLSGGAFPVAFGLARRRVPERQLPGVVASLSAMFGVGGAVGMAVAGPLADALGTDWLFLLTLALALPALAGILALRPDGPSRHLGHARANFRTQLDLSGALLLAATLVALLLGISQGRTWGWASPLTVGVLCGALVLGAGFVFTEARAAAPLLDLRLLRGGGLAATHTATVIISVAMFAAVTLIPQFVQTPDGGDHGHGYASGYGYGFGFSAARTGLVIAPMAVCMLLAVPVSARLAARTGNGTTFRIGAALAAATLLSLGVVHDRLWHFLAAGAALGTAYGFAFASLGGLVVDAVPAAQTGAATGVNTILRTIGGAAGAQLATAIVAGSAGGGSAVPTESGYSAAFCAAAVAATAALLISVGARGGGTERSASGGSGRGRGPEWCECEQ